MTLTAATLLALGAMSSADPRPPCTDELFRIERSKNANVIVYELHRRPDGAIDPAEPVRASWLLLAGDGRREDLNFLERALAYGFEVKQASPGAGWILTLKAEKKRPLNVREVEGCTRAMVVIGGQEGALERVYVKADDGKLIPNVEYVDVFGIDPATLAARRERIVPEPPQPQRSEWSGP